MLSENPTINSVGVLVPCIVFVSSFSMSKLQGVIYIGACAGTYIYADYKVYSLAGRVVLPQLRRADAAGSMAIIFIS
jgi:hypothetical protein